MNLQAELFTIITVWNPPKCVLLEERIKNVTCTYMWNTIIKLYNYNGILFNYKKAGNSVICNMDSLGGHWDKWNKPGTKT